MTDGVIKGTGNSRFLKSSISADTTLTQLITMLRDGTFPIDLNGINAAGWTTLATALNKANLLDDTTANKIATAMGVTAPTTPNEALNDLAVPPIYQKLLSTTVGTAAPSVSLDLSSIDTTGYSKLIVLPYVKTSATATINVTYNSITSNYYYKLSSTETESTTSVFIATFPSSEYYASAAQIDFMYYPGSISNYWIVMAHSVFSSADTLLDELGSHTETSAISSIAFTASTGNIAVGSKFTVYGVKA